MMMYTMRMAKGYEITEKDIDGMLYFLKTHDPEHATPEMAIAMLEELQARVHLMAHTDLKTLKEILSDLKKKKRLKMN